MRKQVTLIAYYSKRFGMICAAIFMDNENGKMYIKNSGESIWIDYKEILSVGENCTLYLPI
jgi:hypothetical protein